jgi:hypothetical protein
MIIIYNVYMKNKKTLYNLDKPVSTYYDARSFNSRIKSKISEQKNVESYIITYDSPFNSGIDINDRVYLELFIPQTFNKKSEIIILLHGFTSKKNKLKNYYNFIDKATNKNHACAFINLPFHLHRTPQGERSGQRLIQNRDIETLNFFNQSVLDIKKGMGIIENFIIGQKNNKKSSAEKLNFSICGISLGGMISVITMAWEKRLKKAVLLQCGGNWDKIYWNSLVRIVMRGCFIDREKIKREQARQYYMPINEFIGKYKSINPVTIDYDLSAYPELSAYHQKTWFLSDPVTFAHKVSSGNTIMINSRFDILFCRESTLDLWEELGKPKIYWFNEFHTSGALSNKRIQKIIFDFLAIN